MTTNERTVGGYLRWLLAALSLGTIGVAILSHLTKLGVTLPAVGDHGELFALAVLVFVCSAAVLVMHRNELLIVGALVSVSRQ